MTKRVKKVRKSNAFLHGEPDAGEIMVYGKRKEEGKKMKRRAAKGGKRKAEDGRRRGRNGGMGKK